MGKDTPPGIQVLVVNKNTKLPGTGIALFSETDTDFPGQVEAEQARVYAYPRWDDVLRDLNLESAPSNATLVETAKGFSGGGESEEHRQLKEYVRDHPEILGLRHKSKDATLEERLPSGDSLDVSFESSQRWTAVEVKSAKSDKADPGYPFNRTHPGLQFSRGGSLEGDPGSAGARAPRAAWATPPGAAWWR